MELKKDNLKDNTNNKVIYLILFLGSAILFFLNSIIYPASYLDVKITTDWKIIFDINKFMLAFLGFGNVLIFLLVLITKKEDSTKKNTFGLSSFVIRLFLVVNLCILYIYNQAVFQGEEIANSLLVSILFIAGYIGLAGRDENFIKGPRKIKDPTIKNISSSLEAVNIIYLKLDTKIKEIFKILKDNTINIRDEVRRQGAEFNDFINNQIDELEKIKNFDPFDDFNNILKKHSIEPSPGISIKSGIVSIVFIVFVIIIIIIGTLQGNLSPYLSGIGLNILGLFLGYLLQKNLFRGDNGNKNLSIILNSMKKDINNYIENILRNPITEIITDLTALSNKVNDTSNAIDAKIDEILTKIVKTENSYDDFVNKKNILDYIPPNTFAIILVLGTNIILNILFGFQPTSINSISLEAENIGLLALVSWLEVSVAAYFNRH